MIRCVYTDLDGTLLGKGASLFRTADGEFTLLAARALEACHRAGVEVVIKSGRRRAQVMEDARLLGQSSYIFEVGSGMVIDGELTFLTGDLQPRAYHLIPAVSSKAGAVARHMRARGYAPEECIAVGDSREDLEVAEVVGRLFLVANAAVGDTSVYPNVERTEAPMSEGFYEAVIRALAETRTYS